MYAQKKRSALLLMDSIVVICKVYQKGRRKFVIIPIEFVPWARDYAPTVRMLSGVDPAMRKGTVSDGSVCGDSSVSEDIRFTAHACSLNERLASDLRLVTDQSFARDDRIALDDAADLLDFGSHASSVSGTEKTGLYIKYKNTLSQLLAELVEAVRKVRDNAIKP